MPDSDTSDTLGLDLRQPPKLPQRRLVQRSVTFLFHPKKLPYETLYIYKVPAATHPIQLHFLHWLLLAFDKASVDAHELLVLVCIGVLDPPPPSPGVPILDQSVNYHVAEGLPIPRHYRKRSGDGGGGTPPWMDVVRDRTGLSAAVGPLDAPVYATT